jgi:SAM-dependent methyltransferase
MTQYTDKHGYDLTWSPDHKHASYLTNHEIGHASTVYLHEMSAHDLSYFPDDYFDRVVSTCLIQHVTEVEKACKEWRRVVRPGGTLDIYIHSEPGMLLRFIRMVFLSRVSDENGTKHIDFVESEHRYSFIFCRNLIKTVFGQDSLTFTSYPIYFQSWNFSFWKIARITLK